MMSFVGNLQGDGETVEDVIEDEDATVDELALQRLLEVDVDNVLHTLSPRECGVLRMRYGLDDGVEKTLEEIGYRYKVTPAPGHCGSLVLLQFCISVTAAPSREAHLFLQHSQWHMHQRPTFPQCALGGAQVTRERIRQIECKALRKMKQPMRQSALKDYERMDPEVGFVDRKVGGGMRSG